MGSKKILYLILIITLAIFLVSLAFDRPPWQAAVFSIVFLLLATVVRTRGLLIPERLFDRRLPRRPPAGKSPETTGKTEFLKRMESVLDELSTESGATNEDTQWITEYTRVMQGIGELAYEVHENVRSKDRARQLRAFRGAVKKLPSLISEFKNIPEPIAPKRQEAMKRQTQGLDLYLLACSNFAEASETSDGELAGLAAEQINEALNLLDIMGKLATTRGWR